MLTRHGAIMRGEAPRLSARYAAVELCGAPPEVGAFRLGARERARFGRSRENAPLSLRGCK